MLEFLYRIACSRKLGKYSVMRAYEFYLFEAQGGMWDRMLEKKSGANIQFAKDNQTYDLIDVQVFPSDQRLKYELDDESSETQPVDLMKNDIEQYVQQQGASIEKYFGENKNSGAAIVVIIGDKNKKIAFVKFVKEKKSVHPPVYWQTSVFTRDTGWDQTGKGKSATAKAAEIRISPYDFVKPGRYQIVSLPNLIEQNLNSRPESFPQNLKVGLPALIDDLIKNTGPVPNLEQYADQIEVVFGETAAPIALSLNKRVSGSYRDAEQNLLEPLGLSWANFKEVSFGAFGEKIGDSFLWAGKNKIIISSKNKTGGAPASLTGAMETLEKFPDEFGPGTSFYKKYSSILPTLEVLHKEKAISGVLSSSVLRGLITKEEKDYIISIYGKGTGSKEDLEKFPNLPTVYNAKAFLGAIVTNKAGNSVISRRGVDVNNFKFQLGYHLLGNCAKLLKASLNKDTELMTEFFKAILNKADMVQVYTNTSRSAQGITFSDFNVVWPPTFSGRIEIESDHYTSNARPQKKISFMFK
jgi:hypothetical protein